MSEPHLYAICLLLDALTTDQVRLEQERLALAHRRQSRSPVSCSRDPARPLLGGRDGGGAGVQESQSRLQLTETQDLTLEGPIHVADRWLWLEGPPRPCWLRPVVSSPRPLPARSRADSSWGRGRGGAPRNGVPPSRDARVEHGTCASGALRQVRSARPEALALLRYPPGWPVGEDGVIPVKTTPLIGNETNRA